MGVLKMLHGVPCKKIVRKVTRTYTSRNRDKVKRERAREKYFRRRRKSKIRRKYLSGGCISAVDRKSKFEAREKRSGGKERV